MPSIQELQPYLSLIAAVLSVATLGFVVRLAFLLHGAEQARSKVVEERLKFSEERREASEQVGEQTKQKLTEENEQLRSELEKALSGSGFTLPALATGRSLDEATETVKSTVTELLRKMEDIEKSQSSITEPSWHLEFAKGYMAQRKWAAAASHFDRYVEFDPSDFDVQYSRGVAHANSRLGGSSDLSALRAYNETIAFMPPDLGANAKARYFTYRGAMLKRLNRLDEAEADLLLASGKASKSAERNDVQYNLASVYAMMNDKDKMLNSMRKLRGCAREKNAMRHHMKDYFSNFANDKDFIEELNK